MLTYSIDTITCMYGFLMGIQVWIEITHTDLSHPFLFSPANDLDKHNFTFRQNVILYLVNSTTYNISHWLLMWSCQDAIKTWLNLIYLPFYPEAPAPKADAQPLSHHDGYNTHTNMNTSNIYELVGFIKCTYLYILSLITFLINNNVYLKAKPGSTISHYYA